MFPRLKRWYRSTVLRNTRIPFQLWQQSTSNLSLFNQLNEKQLIRLRKLTGIFLHEKRFTSAAGMDLSETIKVQIAAQACLLILNRNLSDFDGWHEVIVYPDAFIVEYEHVDEAGVMHRAERTLGGEAWGRGPVILSWADADPDRQHSRHPGSNVVLHEFAHKLDMLNGVANGMPVLNKDMKREDWTRKFSCAYERLLRELEHGRHVSIDPYAAQSPAEFFAVVSEYFFMAPEYLHEHYPGIYGEMTLYYRQNPLKQI